MTIRGAGFGAKPQGVEACWGFATGTNYYGFFIADTTANWQAGNPSDSCVGVTLIHGRAPRSHYTRVGLWFVDPGLVQLGMEPRVIRSRYRSTTARRSTPASIIRARAAGGSGGAISPPSNYDHTRAGLWRTLRPGRVPIGIMLYRRRKTQRIRDANLDPV